MKGIPNMSKFTKEQKETLGISTLQCVLGIIVAILIMLIITPYVKPYIDGVKKRTEIVETVSEDAKNNLSKYYDMVVENKPTDPYDNTSKIETFVTMTLKNKYSKEYSSFLEEKIVIYVKSVGKNGIRYEIYHDDNISIGQIVWDSFSTKTTLGSGDTIYQKQFSPNTFSEIERLFNEKSKLKQ
jgi:hypothetical protein